jgi:hypothetical protein
MNGQEFAEFVLIISKQINETNVINYGDLSITYHNVARDNLKRIKSEITNKLKILEETLKERPLSWKLFNEAVSKLRIDSLNEFKANFTVWIDTDNLKGGDNLDKEKADGITNTSLLICFISEKY